ncbi:putative mucin-associated surface protein (MASP) [Trypanosoma theileri]|uniref:Putative mucin-associated surface protein (MASP) n=1 Tax=Trypanosoma theileri TaxID=67003 RepID=A0A1X0P7T5_9TRYP|nr:putative mucin-associated surface protein (MASP) [Trypanosoma theileri]ORC93007.1 putative mucin-associated surface protein (MASP) [Trypanosoma theileri]
MKLFFVLLLHVLLSVLLLTHDRVYALCPANGNTHVIYITSNMGNNIWAFDTVGHYIGTVLNKSSFPFAVDKLRDMKFGPDNHLYISSARGQYSRIFAVSGNGLLNGTLNENCTRNYIFTVTKQSSDNPFLDHPYSMAFHPEDDSLFVANQNSVTVTRYIRVDKGKKKYPEWIPIENMKSALSNESSLPSMSVPVNIPNNAGLFASSWSSAYFMASVRGLTLSPLLPRALVEQAAPAGWFATERKLLSYYVLVCDMATDQVHVFIDQTGEHVFSLPVPSPVQVLFPSRFQKDVETPASYFEVPHVYVTSKEDGMTYLLPFVAPPQQSQQIQPQEQQEQGEIDGGIRNSQRRWVPHPVTKRVPQHSSSGIYENPSHDMLLIADRNGRRISTYASPYLNTKEANAGPSPFLGYFTSKLPDQPEFILTTMVEHQASIPFCYELREDGTFRYVALCTAAYIWTSVLVLVLIFFLLIFLIHKMKECHKRCSHPKKHKPSVSDIPSEEVPLVTEHLGGKYGTSN